MRRPRRVTAFANRASMIADEMGLRARAGLQRPPGEEAVRDWLCSNLAAHLASGFTLQPVRNESREESRTGATMKHSGRVKYPTIKVCCAQALAMAALQTRAEELRRPREGSAPALDSWNGRMDGRWTLLSRFESNGERYIFARETNPTASSAMPLTSRERQVLARAAQGRTNKEIAFELGLAPPTVRVLIARAAKKFGARKRADLVARFKSAVPDTQDLEGTQT